VGTRSGHKHITGERPGEAHDNGLSKVIAIYAAQGGLTTN
jgi:hypothetical protein